LSNRLLRAFQREDGNATVEAVLWMPIYMALFGMIIDVSLVFGGQSDVLRIVQDTNRAVSLGRFDSLEAAQANIETKILAISSSAIVTVEVIDGVISSVVVIPASDLTATGLFDGFADVNVVVRAQHLSEA
jgi:Flp pilus assembly protein TadG